MVAIVNCSLCTYPCRGPGVTFGVPHAVSEPRQEDNEGNRVEHRDDQGVVVLQLEPAERQRHVDGVLQLEQVEETPQKGQDERSHNHEQEPVVVPDSVVGSRVLPVI